MRDILWWTGVFVGGALFYGVLEFARQWRARDVSAGRERGDMTEMREYGRRW